MICQWLLVCIVPLFCSQFSVKAVEDVHDGFLPDSRLSSNSGHSRFKWNLVKDKHQHAEKSFLKPEGRKPLLVSLNVSSSWPQSPANNTRINKKVKVDENNGKVKDKIVSVSRDDSQSALSMEPACSRQYYTITLKHGNCTQDVLTTMCYGMCKSYTVPVTSSFNSTATVRHRLGNVCHCCTPRLKQTTTKRVHLACTLDGRLSKKIFHVPVAASCECRQCVVN